jgi:flagellar basal-body rod protein FlgG
MLKGLYDAAAGMKARLAVQDVIASNLANAGTSGFQHQIVSIQDHRLPSLAQTGTGIAAAARAPREVLEPVSAPDTRSGVLQQTGARSDIALDGPGYLMVQTSAGPRLLRGGSMHANRQGYLATLAGDPLLSTDGRPIAVGTREWQVAPDGAVSAEGRILGRLRIARPAGPVQAEGATLASTAGVLNVPAAAVRVRQGFLEHSNVEPVKEMVDMIAGVRAYEASQKAVLAQDESLQSLLEVLKQA